MPDDRRLRFLLHARTSGYAQRIMQAENVIRMALDRVTHPHIGLSTGKDSTVMADLVWRQRPDIPAVYFDADCAFPESYAYLDALAAAGRPIIRWPCEPLLETFARLGGPTAPGIERATMESTVYAPIRSLLATYAFDGTFLGLRMDESHGRMKVAQVRGQLFWRSRDTQWECLPMARLRYEDVWAYIVSRDVVYNAAYDRMWEMPESTQRVSYWAGETARASGRYVFLRREYPDLYNRFVARFPEVGGYT